MAGSGSFNLEEWDQILGKLHRLHDNTQEELSVIIQTIKREMKSELIPLAEEKANFGKVVKASIREMWSLEYEITDIQAKFNQSCLANLDINSLTDDIVEDIMLQSKPLQLILLTIRKRQKEKSDVIKKEYKDMIANLAPLKVNRPPKPELKPAEVAPAPETAPMASVSA